MVRTGEEQATRRWAFDHHRLDAYRVALEALVAGDAMAKQVPRGHGTLVDQFRRALEGAFTQTTEASARAGADRLSRFRTARAEAGEAAGIVEALGRLGLAGSVCGSGGEGSQAAGVARLPEDIDSARPSLPRRVGERLRNDRWNPVVPVCVNAPILAGFRARRGADRRYPREA